MSSLTSHFYHLLRLKYQSSFLVYIQSRPKQREYNSQTLSTLNVVGWIPKLVVHSIHVICPLFLSTTCIRLSIPADHALMQGTHALCSPNNSVSSICCQPQSRKFPSVNRHGSKPFYPIKMNCFSLSCDSLPS